MTHKENEREVGFDLAPDGLYRGSIKIEEKGSIVIDSINLKQMNMIGSGNEGSINGFELEVLRSDSSDTETSLFYELLRRNLGNSIQFQFVLQESSQSRMLICGMNGIILCDDPADNIRLSCIFSDPLDVSAIK